MSRRMISSGNERKSVEAMVCELRAVREVCGCGKVVGEIVGTGESAASGMTDSGRKFSSNAFDTSYIYMGPPKTNVRWIGHNTGDSSATLTNTPQHLRDVCFDQMIHKIGYVPVIQRGLIAYCVALSCPDVMVFALPI